ncbi:hypothetical protein LPW11_00270 [Geomonas sp. RF6]|uniref:hypothetical protein n=1 Tax=Geomonas sp. RF6 TaxID=2897342 RepID=UPI001E30524C|nr:hypothetical protein [Geomonas sp. RF6]UFS70642.1 hypothetical protein LPW11_00270 [Geomonas sp. RF6]
MEGSPLRAVIFAILLGTAIAVAGARGEETPDPSPQADLVNQANAPISSILQLRLLESYHPEYLDLHGDGNAVLFSVTMPLPKRRLIPLPQLSLLSIPAAITLPGGVTGSGDLRFLDLAVFYPAPNVIWGVGPVFVFPTASRRETGQEKWQVGPAAGVAFTPERWLVGVLLQNPISFAGEDTRKDVSVMVFQPFASYQLGKGWFLRSQPQMLFNWKNGKKLLPVDLGVGRVFRIGRQDVSCFVEPFWNVEHDGPAPKYGVAVGVALIYPNFWKGR